MRNVNWGKNVYGMMRYLKRVRSGFYRLEWQGDVVEIQRAPVSKVWDVYVNGNLRVAYPTFNQAVNWVDNIWGSEEVETYNMLNRAAGPLKIARKNYGGCTDPGTETYWSM